MVFKTTNTFSTTATSSTTSIIQDRWVINLCKKELSSEEKSLQQKGPKFAATPVIISIKEYISTTTVAAVQKGELNGVDCSQINHDVNRILNTYTNKPIHTNITKAKHLALENLRKDIALIVMHKTECTKRCEALLQDTSVYKHLSTDTYSNIHKELNRIL